MAAMRAALAMLGRRSCGSSGPSAATSVGRGGLEIRQVLRPAVPPLRPAAGYQRAREGRRERIEMAALRSALAMVTRRSCGSFGSSATASMGRRGLDIHQVPRTAAPALRPAAVRNLENWRRFSTGGSEPADKAESVLLMWWQRARDRVENADPVAKSKAIFAYGMVVAGAPTLFVLSQTKKWF